MDASRLCEIKDEMLELLGEAHDIVRALARESHNDIILARAEAYWLPHVEMALSNDHQYLGGSMCSMEDTIQELNAEEGEEHTCPLRLEVEGNDSVCTCTPAEERECLDSI